MFLPSSRFPASCALLACLVVLTAGCAHRGPGPAETASTIVVGGREAVPDPAGVRNLGERAATVAAAQVGVPYRYGGDSADGFDCSGLVTYAYANVGRRLPRTTAGLWHATRPVRNGDLQVGDLLFFDIEGKVGHVALYLGDRRFVHAPASGREVTIADLDSAYYRQAFIRGGRP